MPNILTQLKLFKVHMLSMPPGYYPIGNSHFICPRQMFKEYMRDSSRLLTHLIKEYHATRMSVCYLQYVRPKHKAMLQRRNDHGSWYRRAVDAMTESWALQLPRPNPCIDFIMQINFHIWLQSKGVKLVYAVDYHPVF